VTKDSLLGQQLDEYRLEALLGQGGMARVYRGLDVRLKRYVAVKVIDTPFRANPDYVSRFEREAQAIAQLEHPHIVRLYRYGEANGLLYMAMQYIKGASLAYVLASYRADKEFIAPEDARRIIREVCLALDYAHSQGVIHRDVKPSNIILDQQGRAILTDFGLALLTEVGTRGEIMGSPHYIAPEQAISSAAVVPQSDQYSVGVILYEMFTGELPFDAEAPLDIARLHMTEPPRPPRELRADISPELEAVILKTLAKEPEERYPIGAALADALDQALRVKSIKAPSPSTVPRPTIPERVVVQQARHPLPPIPAAVSPAPQKAEPKLTPAPITPAASAAAGKRSTFSILERMGGLAGVPRSWRRRYRIFLGIIVLAGLCYSAGFAALALAPSNRIALVTATATRTPIPTASGVTLLPGVTLSPSPTQFIPPTFTPSPTASPTLTPSATATPTFTPTSTDTPSPSPTPTPTPTDTPAPTATPTPATVTYDLLIAKRGDDSLFVVNQTRVAFPLEPLRLGDGDGAIDGEDWDVDTLQNGECVTAWKDSGNPRPPRGVKCNEVGARLTRDGPNRFWQSAFNIYYAGELIATCAREECSISILVK